MAAVRNTRDVGAAVRAAREAQGLTQAQVAAMAQVSRRWLIAIEKGEHPRAELNLVLALLDVLQLEISLGSPDSPSTPAPADKAPWFDLDRHLTQFREGD